MTVVAVDIGGSGSRILLADGREASATGPAVRHGAQAEAVAVLARAVGPVPAVDAVAVSTTGLISSGDPAGILAAIQAEWDPATVLVMSDAVAAVVGAWGEAGGAVVAAGTGVVGFGSDLASTWARVDGWGHELGDDGGGAWIGASGLRAALREFDGRPGGSARLLSAAADTWGDVTRLPEVIRHAENPATVLGAFAPQVSAAAEAGDPLAAGILADAGTRLARTGLAALVAGVPRRLALTGGLAGVARVAGAFLDTVRAAQPDLEVVTGPTAGSPLQGALRLARGAAERTPAPHPPYLFVHHRSAHPQGAS
jgi:N-acetylglucosamine kinase-like BadF-type ATPase